MEIIPGMTVYYLRYGIPQTGIVKSISNGIVFLTNGKWLHLVSVSGKPLV